MKTVFLQIFFIILLLLFLHIRASAQKHVQSVEPGFGVAYDFQSNGIAPEIRVQIPVYRQVFVSPRAAYFPAINKIHELYAGLDAAYHYPAIKKITFYNFLGVYFNYWFNFAKFNSKVARQTSMVFEGGAGAGINLGNIIPFLEGRYDSKWKEGLVIIGVKFRPGRKSGMNRAVSCPEFN